MRTVLLHKAIIVMVFSFFMRSDFSYGMEPGKELAIKKEKKHKEKKSHHRHRPIKEEIIHIAKELLPYDVEEIRNNPYKDMVAQVRRGANISEGESAYRLIRDKKVLIALEKFLHRDLTGKRIPIIAGAGSGGGYRAMFCTQGFREGLEAIGLSDTFTYFSALSGSTWQLAPHVTLDMPLKEFGEHLGECGGLPFHEMTKEVLEEMFDMLKVKKESGQPIGMVDFYSAMLANRLLSKKLGKQLYQTCLSQQVERVELGDIPYPIYIASDARAKVADNPPIFVLTPHEVGFLNSDVHIPTWAYGRTFKKEKSTNNVPEEHIGYAVLGTCGSAFGADMQQIIDELPMGKEHPWLKWLEEGLIKHVKNDRPLPFYAKVPNYMYRMEDQSLSKNKHIKLVDAGLYCNIPIQPLFERANVIFIFDSSAGQIGDELKKVEADAQKRKMPFPKIDYIDIDKKTISIFRDKNNKDVPTIIYMPRISDSELWEKNKSNHLFKDFDLSGFDLDYNTNHGPCATQHFQYEPALSKKVMNQTMFNMIVNKEIIMRVMNDVIDNI